MNVRMRMRARDYHYYITIRMEDDECDNTMEQHTLLTVKRNILKLILGRLVDIPHHGLSGNQIKAITRWCRWGRLAGIASG
jgi:hypothetical protein